MAHLKSFGQHYIVEFLGCDPAVIGQVNRVRPVFEDAVVRCGATALEYAYHQFEPHGVSATVLLAESHFSIHSWPEHGYMALDIFTCGETMDADLAVNIMKEGFVAREVEVTVLDRGIPE